MTDRTDSPARTPLYKRPWFLILATLLVIVVAAAISGGDDDTPRDATPDPAPAVSADAEPSTSESSDTTDASTEDASESAKETDGLGVDRETLKLVMGTRGYDFEDAPLADGRERWMASNSARGTIIDLIGPSDDIDEVSLVVYLSGESQQAQQAGHDMGMLFGAIDEEYAEWATSQITENAGESTWNEARRFTTKGAKIEATFGATGDFPTLIVSLESTR
jgi:hypothetical protein